MFALAVVWILLNYVLPTGIWEVNLERPSTKNAIGRDMLRGLQYTLESVNNDLNAKVLMICSSVPKVFCAGADLKVEYLTGPICCDLMNSTR